MSRPGYSGGGAPPRQPPLSFKTVPGRNRTQKWNQAKTYNYDGDDWGGFDPYDEYGGDQPGDDQQQQSPQHENVGQPHPVHHQQPGMMARQQSFEVGSERRQFSAPTYPTHPDQRRGSPAMSAGSGSDHERRRMHEYSSSMQHHPHPTPPHMRTSSAHASPTMSRKGSASSMTSPPSGSKSPDKPLPFIRPSDIYKRMAEEKEKERKSMESSRPSMDSLQQESTTPNSAQRPLSTVQERPGSGDVSAILAAAAAGTQSSSSTAANTGNVQKPDIIPPIPETTTTTTTTPAVIDVRPEPTPEAPRSTSNEPLRSIVQTAFQPADSDTSASASAEISRSNTDSTSAISPIMPAQNHPVSTRDDSVSTPTSHSRNVSAETMMPSKYHGIDNALEQVQAREEPRRTDRSFFDQKRSSANNSPARTPDIGKVESKRLSGPMAAEVANVHDEDTTIIAEPEPEHESSTDTTSAVRPGRPRRGTDYSIREADLAREANQDPESLGQTQQHLQKEFLNEHESQENPAEVPLQRQWSFDASPGLEELRSAETLSMPPTPFAERTNSFQPHLPGEWISAAPTPVNEEQTILPTHDAARETNDDVTATTPTAANVDEGPQQRSNDIPDLSPLPNATSQHQAPKGEDPATLLAAAKNAGSALGAAFMSSVGTDHHQTRDFAAPKSPVDSQQTAPRPRGPSGEVRISHPPLYREFSLAPSESNTSMATSSRPPTPPAKDLNTPRIGTIAAADTKDEDAMSTKSDDSSASDFESDRLRRDIVRSLDMSNSPAAKSAHLGLSHDIASDENRDSTHLEVPSSKGPSATTRLGFLDQRFSWESQVDRAPLAEPPMAAVGETPGDENRQSYERPDAGQGLHVINAPKEELQSPIVSPVAEETETRPETADRPSETLAVPVAEGINRSEPSPSPEVNRNELSPSPAISRNELSPSPASMNESTHIPSYYAGLTDAPIDADADADAARSASVTSAVQTPPVATPPSASQSANGAQDQTKRQSSRIPPFREILAMKTPTERLQAYQDTRKTFSSMDTGLHDWLSAVLDAHPEHDDLKSGQGSAFPDGAYTKGHRHNQSLFKIKQFGSTHDVADRSAKRNSDNPPPLPPKDIGVQMEKMQAKGKDIMKSAGVLGGKAQAGAKGLIALGKSRFARSGDKASKRSKAAPPTSESPLKSSPMPAERSHHATIEPVDEPDAQQIVPPPAEPVVDEHERERRRDSFKEKVRRRSKSLTRYRDRPSRPASIVYLQDDEPLPATAVVLKSSIDVAELERQKPAIMSDRTALESDAPPRRSTTDIEANNVLAKTTIDAEPEQGSPIKGATEHAATDRRSRARKTTSDAEPESENFMARVRRRSRSISRSMSRPLSLILGQGQDQEQSESSPRPPSRPGMFINSFSNRVRSRSRSLTKAVSRPMSLVMSDEEKERLRYETQYRQSSRPQSLVLLPSWSHTPIEAVPPLNIERYRQSEYDERQERSELDRPSSSLNARLAEFRQASSGAERPRTMDSPVSALNSPNASPIKITKRGEQYRADTGDEVAAEPARPLSRPLQALSDVPKETATATEADPAVITAEPEEISQSAVDTAKSSPTKSITQSRRMSDIATLPSQVRAHALSRSMDGKDGFFDQYRRSVTGLKSTEELERMSDTSQQDIDERSGVEAARAALDGHPPAATVLQDAQPGAERSTVAESRESQPLGPLTHAKDVSAVEATQRSHPEIITAGLPKAVHKEELQEPVSLAQDKQPSSKPSLDIQHGAPARPVDTSNTPAEPKSLLDVKHDSGNDLLSTGSESQARVLPTDAQPAILTQPTPRDEQSVRQTTTANEEPYKQRPIAARLISSNGSETPLEERIDRSFATSTFAIDINNLGKPSSDEQRTQEHPALRGIPEDERPSLRSPPAAVTPDKSPIASVTPVQDKSTHRTSIAGVPSARNITDQFGLEDVTSTTLSDDTMPTQPTEKTHKRRSSVWESIKRARTSSTGAPTPNKSEERLSRHSPSVATPVMPSGEAVAPVLTPETTSQPELQQTGSNSRTLSKKSKRMSKSMEPVKDEQKKRFSGFGSFFGRSKTPGTDASKTGKLTKKMSVKEGNKRRSQMIEPTIPRVMPSARPDYASYEASRKRHSAFFDYRRPDQDENGEQADQLGRSNSLQQRSQPVTFEPGHAWYNHFVNSVHQYPDPQPQGDDAYFGQNRQQQYRPSDQPDGLSYHKVRGHGLQTDLEHGPGDLMTSPQQYSSSPQSQKYGQQPQQYNQSGRRFSQESQSQPQRYYAQQAVQPQQYYAQPPASIRRRSVGPSSLTALPESSHEQSEGHTRTLQSRNDDDPINSEQRVSQPAYSQTNIINNMPNRGPDSSYGQVSPTPSMRLRMSPDANPADFDFGFARRPNYLAHPRPGLTQNGSGSDWRYQEVAHRMRGVSYPGQEWVPPQ